MAKGKLYVIAGVLNGGGSSSPCDAPKAAAAVGATKAVQANLGINVGTLRFDAAGNILLADMGGDYGAPSGANSYEVPPRLTLNPARTGSNNGQKMTVGYIYAIAGLGATTGNGVPAVDSDIAVSGLAIDHAGNVLVAGLSGAYPDDGVWVIAARTGTFYGQQMRRDDVYVLPGLTYANLLAVDNAGNVLVVEASTFRVKMLAEKTGDYYGVKARAGRVYTIAGDGKLPL